MCFKVFVLMLRITGMFQTEIAAVTTGVLLVVATVAMFVAALVLTNEDRLKEQRAYRSESNSENDENASEEIDAPQTTHDIDVEAREDNAKVEDSGAASGSFPWQWLILGSSLCGAQPEDDGTPAPSSPRTAEEGE